MNSVVDIRNVPIMWMTCDKSIGSRQDGFLDMMSKLGLQAEKMNGDITSNYNIGVASEYIKALCKYDPPFLILEDDARINPNIKFEYEYDLTEGMDALYLGTSIVGRINKETKIGVIAADAGKYNRIFNMLSFHAVLYLSKKYVNKTISLLQYYLDNPIGACDDILAENMWKSNVFSLKEPVFYQNDGRNEAMTLNIIRAIL